MTVSLPAIAQQLDAIDRIVFDDPSAALRLCKTALQSARSERDVESLVRAATLLSLIEDQLGERSEGSVVLAEALACCQMYGLAHLEPAVQERLGRDNYTGGDYRLAMRHWAHSVRQCGSHPMHCRTRALALIGLGHVCSAYGALGRASEFHQLADKVLTPLGDVYLIAKVRISLGWDLCALGRHEEAQPILNEALALCKEQNFNHYQAELLLRLAEIETTHGNLEAAEQLLEESLAILVFTPSHWCEANVLKHLAQLRARQGALDMAMNLALRALHITEADGMRHVEALIHADLAGYAAAAGQQVLAEQHRARHEQVNRSLDQGLQGGPAPDLSSLDDLLAIPVA
ncbi:Tetratricopeptide repeat-containing protein [Andreprevotia lacus DSM 23236]|jgi:tetratricopeptide (TPR) repeat protein|uniref:Tetratricopeptide repeat-containing protein n=1 Tax=Andreprevotia lacus DSM 23236 TaxID=1121001 RepID=A0A1W1Y1L6_9NEIS|nr:tetratricopeptide repeat protein [Andreprevotia lacus]SMC29691.1 Tetratricopeptide repeat-containing protein [Andreprevotia lacus DSM 23236]